MSNSSSSSGGIGFFGLLAILFIGLKLGGLINWSWWWVLAPLWGPMAVAIILIAVSVSILGLAELIKSWDKK